MEILLFLLNFDMFFLRTAQERGYFDFAYFVTLFLLVIEQALGAGTCATHTVRSHSRTQECLADSH